MTTNTVLMAAHAPSNDRIDTGIFMQPSHYDFAGEIIDEINLLKSLHPYVEVSDNSVKAIREASGNSKNLGDALEIILFQELSSYSGMLSPDRMFENKDGEAFETLDDEEDCNKGLKVFTSLRDVDNRVTLYFLR